MTNPDKINYEYISSNPSIFKLDYEKMRINFQPLAEEIITEALNPDRIQRLSVIYNFEFKDWINKN